MTRASFASSALLAFAVSSFAVLPVAAKADSDVQVIDMGAERPTPAPPKKAKPKTKPKPQPSATPAGLPHAEALVRNALGLIGTPFVMGGTSPRGFDCSGYVQYVFATVGIAIPRTADLQFYGGRDVTAAPQPGDLVFFQTYAVGPSHVGIYLGDGRFVNAIGKDVHIDGFDSTYFRGRYLGARRYLPG